MIDHLELQVGDLARSTAFYERALAPLGYTVHVSGAKVGFGGAPDRLDFWLRSGVASAPPPHFAFACRSRDVVVDAHRAALVAGGVDRGAPALLPHIHPTYFAAFVIDPDGHLVELVCHSA